jgi:hypothetical protein
VSLSQLPVAFQNTHQGKNPSFWCWTQCPARSLQYLGLQFQFVLKEFMQRIFDFNVEIH